MKIGILGTGTIASAIVTGFCAKKTGNDFFLSPRSAEKAAALAAQFSEVKVCKSNQEVLDNADWIFITLQKNAFDALRELTFRKEHKVLNMATEMRLDDLKKITGETAILAHVVPLPMIVRGFGPLLVYPEIQEVGQLFAPVADAVYLNKMSDIRPLQLLTCVMSPYYMLLEEFAQFSDSQGVEHDVSVKFIHSLFSALSRRAAEIPNCDLVELANDMTPGGYNEQSMNELMDNGAIGAWRVALDRLLERLEANTKK
jgi:pyrroline-5-carboxylate reductase